MKSASCRVGLFATCSVDLFRPSVGFASATLIEQAGFAVEVPPQSCCGQVNFNNGKPDQTQQLAWQLVTAFEHFDYTVIPSGSCAGMIKKHYPELFQNDSRLERVQAFCDRVYELTTFLIEVADVQLNTPVTALAGKTVTYHDSCAGLRELEIHQQPRQLLGQQQVNITEMQDSDVCCGFGGLFCVKFSDVSNHMVNDKLDNARAVKADVLLGGDVSCLLNIAGKAKRQHLAIEIRHVAEVLANQLDSPSIGEGKTEGE